MIQIRFEEREKIGLQYILETSMGAVPSARSASAACGTIPRTERQELEQELRNVEQAAAHAEELKDLYDQICVVLCQMKDIRRLPAPVPGGWRCRTMWSCLSSRAISSGWRPCAPV